MKKILLGSQLFFASWHMGAMNIYDAQQQELALSTSTVHLNNSMQSPLSTIHPSAYMPYQPWPMASFFHPVAMPVQHNQMPLQAPWQPSEEQLYVPSQGYTGTTHTYILPKTSSIEEPQESVFVSSPNYHKPTSLYEFFKGQPNKAAAWQFFIEKIGDCCYICSFCTDTLKESAPHFTTELGAKKHVTKEHFQHIYCDKCSPVKIFSCKQTLNKHIDRVHTLCLQCPECNSSYTARSKLYAHLHKEHKIRVQSYCLICKERFFDKKELIQHRLDKHTNSLS